MVYVCIYIRSSTYTLTQRDKQAAADVRETERMTSSQDDRLLSTDEAKLGEAEAPSQPLLSPATTAKLRPLLHFYSTNFPQMPPPPPRTPARACLSLSSIPMDASAR